MKIGIDIKAFKNGSTGISRYLRSLLDRLQEMDRKNEYILYECTSSGYKVKNPLWKKKLLPWRLPGILWQQFILPKHLRRDGIDIFWAPEQICPILYNGVIFTTVYDLTAVRFPQTCQWSNRCIQRILFPLTIKKSSYLLPISDFINREVRQFYPSLCVKTVLTTINCGGPKLKIKEGVHVFPEKPVLFFAGNREPRKNLGRLIEAMEILYREGLPLDLRLAGPPGWKNRELHRKIAESPVRELIHFLGYLSEEELMEQYRNCSAVIYPSFYEGFGLPVLEAFSMGARVITSRGTVMEEIAGAAARYFDPFDVADMARVIRSALDEPPPGEKEFLLYKQILDKYSWERSAAELLRLFELHYRRHA